MTQTSGKYIKQVAWPPLGFEYPFEEPPQYIRGNKYRQNHWREIILEYLVERKISGHAEQ